jgi:hypothetical protein
MQSSAINTPIVVTAIESVIDAIKKENSLRIGIDGANSTGKSHLAKIISKELNIVCISLDDYLTTNQGTYLPNLDLDRLKRDLNKENHFVVEGICLLEALSRINESIELLVYVKRYYLGVWNDESICNISDDVDKVIEHEKALDKDQSLGIDEEIIRYHNQYQPDKKADVVFQREEV